MPKSNSTIAVYANLNWSRFDNSWCAIECEDVSPDLCAALGGDNLACGFYNADTDTDPGGFQGLYSVSPEDSEDYVFQPCYAAATNKSSDIASRSREVRDFLLGEGSADIPIMVQVASGYKCMFLNILSCVLCVSSRAEDPIAVYVPAAVFSKVKNDCREQDLKLRADVHYSYVRVDVSKNLSARCRQIFDNSMKFHVEDIAPMGSTFKLGCDIEALSFFSASHSREGRTSRLLRMTILDVFKFKSHSNNVAEVNDVSVCGTP